ncbi:hypothetical protein MAALD49_16480 [Marinobacter shengliensis]|nr:hypothetical protein MAALD49_16480 [Marinobacter shengliensis]
MDERVKKTLEKLEKSDARGAVSPPIVAMAISEAVLTLIERGETVTADTLIAHLQNQAASDSRPLVQTRNEACESALLAAKAKSQSL